VRLKGACGFAAIGIVTLSLNCFSQIYTQRGFLENRATIYPQEAANDRARAVGESLFRYEGFFTPSQRFQVAGSMDFRTDTHHQVDREFDLSWWDRDLRRPLAGVRRLSATYHQGPVTFEAGKQFIRWGKTDILTPTDRFAPRDFLNVVDNDYLAVTAARLNVEKGANTFEAVWSPRLTPSRSPLPDQRWFVPIVPFSDLPPIEVQRRFPGGPQEGLRWNHTGAIEYELSLYRGFNPLPSFSVNLPFVPAPAAQPSIEVFYPQMTMGGGDVAIPMRLLTLKGEAAYFNSSDKRVDEYGLYVVQLERQAGEWFFVGGYAGEFVTKHGAGPSTNTDITLESTFAPDRGLTKTLLGRMGLTIDSNRSIAVETAVRQNGDGLWLKGEYSQAFGQHWRATLNGTLIRGAMADFLGQYRQNSHVLLILRYSF
jgi:hypothetical protein